MRQKDRRQRIGSEDHETPPDVSREEQVGRFSSGQETLPETSGHTRRGSFGDGQTTNVLVDHGFPGMGFRTAFARRREVTSRASEQGLLEAANRSVFHHRGFTLTWDTSTGDLWLTPTSNPEGWWYEEDAG